VVLMTVEDSRNGGGLRFGNRGDFFNDHTLSFALSASAARRQSHHSQRHDALRIDAKLGSFKRYLEPRVEQRTPFAEGSQPNDSPHISARNDLSNPFLPASLARFSRVCIISEMARSRTYPASLKRSIFGSKRERKISASSGSSKQ
jgi:hypothetical protein